MAKALVLSIVIPIIIVGAIAGAFILWAFSNRARIFQMRSGSMRPTLQVGDFLLASPRAADEVKVAPKPYGDIIVFRSPRLEGELIVHRAVDKVMHDGLWFFETQGDANAGLDVWTGTDTWQGMISERLLVGVVIANIPQTWLVLGAVILLLMIILPPVVVALYLRAKHPTAPKTRLPLPAAPTAPSVLAEGKKFCRYCGAENRSDADFCEKCGKKIGYGGS